MTALLYIKTEHFHVELVLPSTELLNCQKRVCRQIKGNFLCSCFIVFKIRKVLAQTPCFFCVMGVDLSAPHSIVIMHLVCFDRGRATW